MPEDSAAARRESSCALKAIVSHACFVVPAAYMNFGAVNRRRRVHLGLWMPREPSMYQVVSTIQANDKQIGQSACQFRQLVQSSKQNTKSPRTRLENRAKPQSFDSLAWSKERNLSIVEMEHKTRFQRYYQAATDRAGGNCCFLDPIPLVRASRLHCRTRARDFYVSYDETDAPHCHLHTPPWRSSWKSSACRAQTPP